MSTWWFFVEGCPVIVFVSYAKTCSLPLTAQGNGDIRLVSATSNSDSGGRLEIYYAKWGTVCNDGFGSNEAQVVCQQLGYTDYTNYGKATDLG